MEILKVKAVGYESQRSWDHKGLTQIVQIIASYDNASLKSLQFLYLQNGNLQISEVVGSNHFNGNKFNTITFQGCNEYVTKVEGISSTDSPNRGIQKLSIHTNTKKYEIFVAKKPPKYEIKTFFSFNFGELNQFGGFHGTQNSVGAITSIGVYFNHLTALPSGFLQATQDQEDEDEDCWNVSFSGNVPLPYVAAAACCSQLLWLKQQLSDYGIILNNVPIFCDNTSAINISKNPVQHSRTKHIDIRHHFLRDCVEKGMVSMEHCRSEDQIADIFTKALNKEPFEKLRLELGMISLE